MDDPKTHEVNQWLLKADNDLRSAQQLFKAEPPLLDTAVWNCQKTAEKALKAAPDISGQTGSGPDLYR